jgi:hypothetical protein
MSQAIINRLKLSQQEEGNSIVKSVKENINKRIKELTVNMHTSTDSVTKASYLNRIKRLKSEYYSENGKTTY